MSGRIKAARSVALSAAALLLLGGCWTTGSTSSEASSANPTPVSPSPAAPSAPAGSDEAPAPACPPGSADATTYKCVGVTVTGAKDEAPTVSLGEGFPPAQELQVADVYEGTGTPVTPGSTLTVQYVGVGQQSGKVFDSSWPSGQPATFALDEVIPGWTQGMLGMKPGGRRLLVIPGSLAYGPDGRPPIIGQDETLVFVVDLVATTPA